MAEMKSGGGSQGLPLYSVTKGVWWNRKRACWLGVQRIDLLCERGPGVMSTPAADKQEVW